MKAVLAVAALLQLVAAQPHHNAHQHLHKRGSVVTEVEVVTAVAPDVIIIVNQFGQPIATSYGKAAATPAPEAAAVESSVVVVSSAPAAASTSVVKHGVHAPPPSSSVLVAASSALAAKPVAASSSVAASGSGSGSIQGSSSTDKAQSSSSSGSGSGSAGISGLGVAYSPYNTDNSCKSQSQVNQDFDILGAKGFGSVRIYNVDCNQVITVGNAAKAHNMKVFAGIYDLSDVAADVALLIEGVANDWAAIDTVSICNECVNSGAATASEIVAAMAIARPLLRVAGFTGDIVTVDTFIAMIANPELCEASDYAAINAHAFFDSNTAAPQAGQWLLSTVQNVQNACSGKKVVVTESGWPSNGSGCNGAACPSEANQQTAISSIKSAFSQDVFLFSGFNDGWKTNNAGTFGAEQFWGIYGSSPSSPFPG